MKELEVWAPRAGTVALVGEEDRFPMTRNTDGWFCAPLPPPDTDYSLSLEGGPPRPDPRSGSQPAGVHGRSRVVDHEAFTWSDHDWKGLSLDELIVYELHVGTFTAEGTFDGIARNLDHLVDLGVTAIELMPVAEFAGSRGWGYDAVDLYAPHHSYGGPSALKQLVAACHRRGLGVILDVVYNHLGPDGNYLAEFGPYFTDRYATPWGTAVNLDGADSGPVRDFLIDNALMWLRDYHFDGLRIDAIHAIVDTSAIHFLEELKQRVEELETSLGRRLLVIAESDLNDPRVVRRRGRGGYGLDAEWCDDFHHSVHALLTGERTGYYADFGAIGHIAKALQNGYMYDGIYSGFRRRRHGRSTEGLGGHNFVGYIQNHDQVGNRAAGERLSSLVSADHAKVAAGLLFTSPFVPLLWQGEEWAATSPWHYFTDHTPQLGAAVSRGRKREFAAFGWPEELVPDPQEVQTFTRSKLEWSELEDPRHADMLDWYRKLIALRKSRPELHDGRMDLVRTTFDESGGWLLVSRGPLTIACNFGSATASVPVAESDRGHEVLRSSLKPPEIQTDSIGLPGESLAIWSRQ
ncbi:MAG: malto-oligosyltrehalose trehalohydrolase [Actinomycetota bacterium]